MCERCEELEERVAWLESELGIQVEQTAIDRVRTAFKMRPQTARMVVAMFNAHGRAMTNMQLFEAIPQHADEGFNDDRSTKLIDVQVCNARKAMGADAIFTIFGKGRGLSPAGMARVAAILNPEMAEAA